MSEPLPDEEVQAPEIRRGGKTRPSLASRALRRLAEVDPKEAAGFLSGIEPDRAARLLRAQPQGLMRLIFDHLSPEAGGSILAASGPEEMASILEAIAPRAAADAFRAMSPETRASALERLSEERKKDLRALLAFPEGSAGRMMRTDVVTFHEGTKVRTVVSKLRQLAAKSAAPGYAYVVGGGNRLRGVLMMRDLLLARADQSVEEVMKTGVTAVAPFADQETMADLVRSRHLLAVPVADADGRLLGAVRASDLVEGGEEAAEDLQLVFGGGAEERVDSDLAFKVSQRLPWLNFNLVTAFLAGSVVSLFEDLISRIALLAVFLPVIAGQSGNAGTQTLAVILRGLVMREVQPEDSGRVVLRETLVGLINGLAIGVVTGIVAYLWKGNAALSAMVAGAMVCGLGVAGLSGAAIPLAMKRMGLDPAQSSGIFLTTVTDVVSFLSFLSFAAFFESFLK